MLPERYTLGNLALAVRNPEALVSELRRQAIGVNKSVTESTEGVSVLQEDWDNLILLDACRSDTFEEVNYLDGELTSVRSKGSNSPQFIQRNFNDVTAHDTVYVSGNGWLSSLDSNPFHAVRALYNDDWDDDVDNVRAESVTEAAIEAHEDFPNKRLIIHYMQPHAPFFGEFGQELQDRVREGKYIWNEFEAGILDALIDEMYRAYEENLEMVLGEAETLVDSLDGKSVISSDHGELFGERLRPIPVRGYEHPPIPHSKLRDVPWLTIDGNRRDIVSEQQEQAEIDSDGVEEKLEALGYM
ncbi:hypothetical protein PNP85_05090 [Halobacterium salinarum]|uniref:hypothetical protein n=1 Tax=Halobacterium salinarum TaxID=2242 RepID=UPI002555404C|nr:hypothetical protein [Halobacterium salinarum]MDL0138875.1 hypothetical protein [Halobacterium salinarum]